MNKWTMQNYFKDNKTDTFIYNLKASVKFYLRTFYHRKNKHKIEQIISSHEDFIKYFSLFPWRAYTILSKSYIINNIPISEGLEYFQKDLHFALSLSQKMGVTNFLLCDFKILEFDDIEVFFGTSDTMAEEGIFSLRMFCKNEEIFEVKFTFARKNALCFSLLQGKKGINELQKELTKKFFGLRAHFFILIVAKYFAQSLGISEFYGIKDKYQASNFKRGKVKKYGVVHILDYDEIWSQLNDQKEILSDDLHFTKLIYYKKSMEEIKSSKRSQYKKRYEMLGIIKKQIFSRMKQI